MYIPKQFVEENLQRIHATMRDNSFATVITQQVDTAPEITHMPLLLDADRGDWGTLVGHFAAANPPSTRLESQTSVAVFHGPHTYISPVWYQGEKVVPTWNYVAIHATGTARLVSDPTRSLEIVSRYVESYESSQTDRWQPTAADKTYMEKILVGVTAFEIEIEKLEACFKLSQHHSSDRRERVVDGLTQRGDKNSIAIAKLMSS